MSSRQLLRHIILFQVLFCAACPVIAQAPKKRVPGPVNMPTTSQIYPSLTGDGAYMVFYSNYTNTGSFELMYSNKKGVAWERGELVDFYRSNLDHIGSHCLSYDGQFMYFSSIRSQGIGGYDIWYCERRGEGWGPPKNLGKPVNSTGNEANPSLSPDGKTLYFTRCESMDGMNKSGCTIYVSRKRSATRWSEPEPLPAPVNLSHETTPRIMIDNETLIFASDRPGGQGKLDLYLTRWQGQKWSDPEPLDFVNSQANDEYISVPARSDILYYTDLYKGKLHHLYMAIIPKDLRPRNVVMITGKVVFDNVRAAAAGARIQAYDAETSMLVTSAEMDPVDGSFYMVLTEGKVYDFSVFPSEPGQLYHADLMDLRAMDRSRWDKPEIHINEFERGQRIKINTLVFEESSPELKLVSGTEIKRLAGFLKKNSGHEIEVAVLTDTTVWYPASSALSVPAPDQEPEEAVEDDWIDDSSWFGGDAAKEPAMVEESVPLDSAMVGRLPASPHLAMDRALGIVNELQQQGVDISSIKPGAYHVGAFESMAGDSLNYWVEIRILD